MPNIQLPDAAGVNRVSRPNRPQTDASHLKNRELEDLARLIQEATGNVNNIVESSQQFMQTRQADRAARLKGKQSTSRTFFKDGKSPRDNLISERTNKEKITIETAKAEASPFSLAADTKIADHSESRATQMTKAAPAESANIVTSDKIVN